MMRRKVLLVKNTYKILIISKIMLDYIQISSHIMGRDTTHYMEDRIGYDNRERP